MHAWTRLAACALPLFGSTVVAADWNYRIGETAPAFVLKTTEGKKLALADLKGHYTVLSFMTSWCPFCNAAAPNFQKIAQEYAGKGVRAVIVDIEEPRSMVRPFAKKHGLTCPMLLDTDGSVAKAYAPPPEFVPDLKREEVMIASFMIIDPDGKIAYLALNEDPPNFDARLPKMRQRLDALLAAAPK